MNQASQESAPFWNRWRHDNIFVRRDGLLIAAVAVQMARFAWLVVEDPLSAALLPVLLALIGPVVLNRRWSVWTVAAWCLAAGVSVLTQRFSDPTNMSARLLYVAIFADGFLFVAVALRHLGPAWNDLRAWYRRVSTRDELIWLAIGLTGLTGGWMIEGIVAHYGHPYGLAFRILMTALLLSLLGFWRLLRLKEHRPSASSDLSRR